MEHLPAKALAMLFRAVLHHSIYRDAATPVTAETLIAELLRPAGLPDAAASYLIGRAQQLLALAAHQNFTGPELAAALEKDVSLPSNVKEALVSFWRDNRDAVHIFLAAAASAGRPTLSAVRWSIATPTASSSASGGALSDAEPKAVLELTIADAAGGSRIVSAALTKGALADVLASLEGARREFEKAAAAGI